MNRKRIKIILILLAVLALLSFGYLYIQKKTEYRQIGSVQYYDSEDNSNLALLCKVWGFLKYYHPSVVDGKYNWDADLIKMMPKVLNSDSKVERNILLSQWVTSLGEFKQDTFKANNPDSVKMYPDLEWIEDREELGILSDQLKKIKTAKRSRENNYYVELRKGFKNLVFSNEETYPEMAYPNASYRLLTLFRYWNIIQYYFPYKYLIGENWQNILTEFIPQFINAEDELEYKLIILKLVTRIHDSHGYFSDSAIEKYNGDYIVPFYVSFIERKAVITDTLIDISSISYISKKYTSFKDGKWTTTDTLVSVTEKNYPLKIGDVILKVNGKPVEKIISEKLPFTSGSNLSAQLRNLSYELMRNNAKSIQITFERDNKVFSKNVACFPMGSSNLRSMAQKNKPLYSLLSKDNIGYLYLGSSIGGTVPNFMNTKGLIIDLRCYPNHKVKGYMNMNQLFVKPVKFVKFTSTDFQQPGLFKYLIEYNTDQFKNLSPDCPRKSGYYRGKVIILINELTQSHAEFMAMMYRCSPNAIVIGSTTAGADGDVASIPLPGNMQTMITGLGVYYPDGRETQRLGIVPDVEIRPTIKGIRDGQDEVLEKAINLIKKTK